MSGAETDITRSAIVFASAGLDASMKRLVNDVGSVLAARPGTGAGKQFEEHLKCEISKTAVSDSFRRAILDVQA